MLERRLLGGALGILVTLGCGGPRTAIDDQPSPTAEGGAGSSGKEAACTDLPCDCVERDYTYGPRDWFQSGSDPGKLPSCLPKCGISRHAGDQFYSIDALPKGPCDPYPYAKDCVMPAHGSCACPTEPGPVNDYHCSCASGLWICSIYSRGACINRCASEVATDSSDGGSSECARTELLSISQAGLYGVLRMGERVFVSATLENLGPRHDGYPGVEVLMDSPYWKPADGAPIAVGALPEIGAQTQAAVEIQLEVVAQPPPCSPMIFHLRVRSFGDGEHCLGASRDFTVVVPLPSGDNCPQCPPIESNGAACELPGLLCTYPGEPCDCTDGHWHCDNNLH